MKRIRIKSNPKLKASIARFLKNIPLAIFAASIIIALLISLPFTEKYIDWMSFNLNPKDNDYNLKTYILQVNVSDEASADNEVNEVKNIINKRLDRYGVEVTRFYDHQVEEEDFIETDTDIDTEGSEEVVLSETDSAVDETQDAETTENEDPLLVNDLNENEPSLGEESDLLSGDDQEVDKVKKYIKVVVETSKDLTYVDTLVRARNDLEIVTPKEDAVFDDPESPIAQYLPENYDKSGFDRNSFRNIAIKELPTSTGDSAYFSIYKVKLINRSSFFNLMDKYAGQMIGIEIDGFVTPYYVPTQFDKDLSNGGSYNPEFAPVVGQDPEDAKLAKILFNSGVIEADYEVYEESTEGELTIPNIDYMTAFFVMLGAVILLTLFLAFNNKSLYRSTIFISTVLFTNAIWFVIWKFFTIKVDLPIVVISGALSLTYICLLTFSRDKLHSIKIQYLIALLLLTLLSSGFLHLAMLQLFIISSIATVMRELLIWFTNNMRYLIQK